MKNKLGVFVEDMRSRAERRAIRRLVNRPVTVMRKLGLRGRELKEFTDLIWKMHGIEKEAGVYENGRGFDGGGVVMDNMGNAVVEFSYAVQSKFIFFVLQKNASLSDIKPLLTFARKFGYSVFDGSEEVGLAIESVIESGKGKAEMFDHAREEVIVFGGSGGE